MRGPGRRARWAAALAVSCLVAVLNLLTWRILNPPIAAPDVPARVTGLAYNVFQRHDDPLAARWPSRDEVEEDLRRLAPLTSRLRTYSAAEVPELPALATKHGFELALGVWLDRDATRNERELAAALDAAQRHGSVRRIIAGNETVLHGALTEQELTQVLKRLRAQRRVPVSTAEPWHVWLRHPELAEQVDFITAHLLPYWEGVPVHAALDEALLRYRQLRERFPHKPVVIGEIGWPSTGATLQAPRWSPELGLSAPAIATPDAQARFVRSFLAWAASAAAGGDAPDYYLMEAIDQPWKQATEGRVGAHWGLWDAARRPKFAFSGPVQRNPFWLTQALASSVLALLLLPPLLAGFRTLRLPGRCVLAVSVQAVASFVVVLALRPLQDYLRAPDVLTMLLLTPALALMAAILLAQVVEFAEMHWPGGLERRSAPRPLVAGEPTPFVSLHLACRNEPAHQVMATIESLVALDWPAFEVVVVDNNTDDERLWRPVQAHVQALAERLRREGRTTVSVHFHHLPQWPGYKAGALNYALAHSDPRAEWIGVIDADYVVARDWLQQLGGWFADARVAVLQAPQAHREWQQRPFERMMNWEYEGFFRIGMHHRHERNAVVQHGTMTLVRASALHAAGAWAEDNLCEDSELGLRLLVDGWRVVYVDRVFGAGLVPSDFAAYARQRQRWAQGAMQIMRRHCAALFGGFGPFSLFRRSAGSRLTPAQRYHFVAGWLPWVGDAAHLVFSLAAMAWSVAVLAWPQQVGPPSTLYVLPLVVFFATRLVMTPLLYRRLVPCTRADVAGAALAGMALSHRVARGVFAGLRAQPAVFHVTRKGAARAAGPATTASTPGAASRSRPGWIGASLADVREEAVLLAGLMTCLLGLALQPAAPPIGLAAAAEPAARGGWMLVLLLQALPYAAALVCSGIGRRAGADRAQARTARALEAESASASGD